MYNAGELREAVSADRQAGSRQVGRRLRRNAHWLRVLLAVHQFPGRHDSPCPQLTRPTTSFRPRYLPVIIVIHEINANNRSILANVNSRSRSLYAVARPSVCRLSVTFVRPTQAVQIFGNISTALGTLAIYRHPLKILRRSSQRNPSAGGVKQKRGSKI